MRQRRPKWALANVIEVLLRSKGDTSGVDKFKRSLSGLGAVAGGLTFAGIAKGAIDAADSVTLLQSKLRLVTSGADDLAKVQNQIVNLGRQTRTDFSAVGELYARVARSSKQLGVSQSDVLRVTKAVTQAIQISGNTAQEASAGMIQLAQALASGTLRGDELRSVLEQMPRVAEAIATGLGTTIGQLRKLGEQGRLTSDLVFKALISQADRLDSEFKKIQPTIAGSFTALVGDLKVAVAEFLKVTGTTDRLTQSIDGLAKGIRGLSGAFQSGFESMNKYWDQLNKWLAESDKKMHSFLGIDEKLMERIKKQAQFSALSSINPGLGAAYALFSGGQKTPTRTRGPTGAQRGRGRQDTSGLLPAVVDIKEFNVTLQKIKDEYGDFLKDMEDDTRTSVQKQGAEYVKLRTSLQFLRSEKIIDQPEYERRLGSALDDLLPEIDLNEIRAKYKVVKKETTELGEFIKGVWQQAGKSIQSTISDAIYEWRISWKSLLDVARRALADITSAIITSGIKKALQNAMSSGASGGGTDWLSTIGSFFGFAAGGGRVDRPTIVGEDGPELLMTSGKVMNQRQMAFGGGSGFTYAPSLSVSIIEKDDAEQTKQEVYQTVAVMLSQDKAEFVRTLQRSGYQVRG